MWCGHMIQAWLWRKVPQCHLWRDPTQLANDLCPHEDASASILLSACMCLCPRSAPRALTQEPRGLRHGPRTMELYTVSFFYFPGLGACPVREFNSRPKCQTHTVLAAMPRSQGFSNETSGLSAGRLPIADARHRFAAGSARRIAKRKQGKNIWGPLPGLCSRAERRFIFYPSSLTSSPHNSRWC